LHSMIKKDK